MTESQKSKTQRRAVVFEEPGEILIEARRLAALDNLTLTGNWSLGQILEHLGRAFSFSVDGIDYRAPWRLRLLGWLLKRRIINQSMPSGFKAPAGMADVLESDAPVSTADGLDTLARGYEKYRGATRLAPHPIFGRLTGPQWDRLHCNHAAMHFSFVLDGSAVSENTD